MKEAVAPLLVLDLDGTVRYGLDELGRFCNGPQDVIVFPQAVERMRAWRKRGGRIIGVSNQGGIALGHVSYASVAAAVAETNRQAENLFDKIAICVHHPDAPAPEYAKCWCRKPSPGLLIETANDLAERYGEIYPPYLGLFVGDMESDKQCAELSGFRFQWASEWRAESAT